MVPVVVVAVVQVAAPASLHSKPWAVSASFPAVIVPFSVAVCCAIGVAALVTTVGGVTPSGNVVKVRVVPYSVPEAVVANALNS